MNGNFPAFSAVAAPAQLRTFSASGIPVAGGPWMRTILFLLLGLIAVGFALIGTAIPFHLPAQAAEDRIYYKQFRTAAEYVDQGGKLPAAEELRRLESVTTGPSIWPSLTTTPLDCDPSFTKAPTDRVVLSFWRGEWSECYAYPSGRTTLPRSVEAYLLSGLGVDLAIYWLIAAAAVWGAIRFRPTRKPSSPPPVNDR